MCRWIAYIGAPIFIDILVTKPDHSLVEQSMNARFSFKPDGSLLATNGDGFGVGWYMHKEEPGLFKTAEPAWANESIREICSQTQAHTFMAHVRAASTGAIQRTNAHPFKYKNWLFQHNGYLMHFETLRRDLHFAIAPDYYPTLKGTTDSETIFLLALSNGLETDPKKAFEKTIQLIKAVCMQHQVPFELALSCAMSNGQSLFTVRYSSGEKLHSQYYSTDADCMKDINQDNDTMPRKSVVIVSEPLDQSLERWNELPPGSFATFSAGGLLRDSKVAVASLEL
jgi:glutamine amidotransferase